MASAGMVPASVVGKPSSDSMLVDNLPQGINEMKIGDDKAEKEMEAAIVNGNGTETGHIIVTTIGGRDGGPKQSIRATWRSKLLDKGHSELCPGKMP